MDLTDGRPVLSSVKVAATTKLQVPATTGGPGISRDSGSSSLSAEGRSTGPLYRPFVALIALLELNK